MTITEVLTVQQKLIAFQEALTPWLNVGCGSDALPGADNVDLYVVGKNIIRADAKELANFPDGHYHLITAHQILEHMPLKDGVKALKEWRRVAKYECRLVLSVPSFDEMLEYAKSQYPEMMYALNTWIYGLPEKGLGMEHKALYSEALLKKMLYESGWEIEDTIQGFPVRFTPSMTIIARAV